MTEKKSINYDFKFLYAIGMILVVAGHCSNGGVSIFYDWFTPYAFHLPLFIFASGYFYKKNDINNCTKSIWHKIKKLILPFYLWNFVYAIIIQILHHLGFQFGDPISFHSLIIAPLINGHQYALNCPSWFVAPLFYIYLLNLIIRKLLKHANDWIFFILFLVFGMCGIKLAMLGYTHGWWLALTRSLAMLPFYGLGILYRSKLEEKDTLCHFTYFTIVLFLQLLLITKCGGTKGYAFVWFEDVDSLYLPYIAGTLGIAFWLRIAKILSPVTKNSVHINWIADHSFTIMINHLSGFFILNCCYACINYYSHGHKLAYFDWSQFRTNVYYQIVPKGLSQYLILYLISGFIISFVIQCLVDIIKRKCHFGVRKS